LIQKFCTILYNRVRNKFFDLVQAEVAGLSGNIFSNFFYSGPIYTGHYFKPLKVNYKIQNIILSFLYCYNKNLGFGFLFQCFKKSFKFIGCYRQYFTHNNRLFKQIIFFNI